MLTQTLTVNGSLMDFGPLTEALGQGRLVSTSCATTYLLNYSTNKLLVD